MLCKMKKARGSSAQLSSCGMHPEEREVYLIRIKRILKPGSKQETKKVGITDI